MTILVGDPIKFDDLIDGADTNISRGKLYDAVSARIGDHLQRLKLQVERLAIEQALHLQNCPSRVTERATNLLQKIDWESLGMGSYIGLDDHPARPKQELSLELNIAQLYPQENSRFKAGFSGGGAFVSRIRGYMDSTELTVFGARGLFNNHRTNEYFNGLRRVSPLKAWHDIWKSTCGGARFPPNSVFAEAM